MPKRISDLSRSIDRLIYAGGTFLPSVEESRRLRLQCRLAVTAITEEEFLTALAQRACVGAKTDWRKVSRFAEEA
ncbi:MAG: hypothetical protein H0W83_09695 [Planctomycetes bacterium]|nr:hypothetical protein [Planctomycetota bacterium]